MPLHLLPKKSWNVYNQANIARVKRDEAQAAARAAEEEEAQQAADARRRMKILRGELPSPPPSTSHNAGDVQQNTESPGSEPTLGDPSRVAEDERGLSSGLRGSGGQRQEELLGRDLTYADRDRTRKRRHGEDDTDRDMRYARQRLDRAGVTSRLGGEDEDVVERSSILQGSGTEERRHRSGNQTRRNREDRDRDAPLVDERGNISLFPAAAAAHLEAPGEILQGRTDRNGRSQQSSDGGNSQLGRGSQPKPEDRGDAYDGTMRFADATAGSSRSKFHQLINESGQGETVSTGSERSGDRSFRDSGNSRNQLDLSSTYKNSNDVGIGRDAFGNEDPKRRDRDAARLAANDPLAAIQRGVRQVRQVERERKRWADERRTEVEELRREDRERDRDRERRRRRQDDVYEGRAERARQMPATESKNEKRRARREEDDDVDDFDLGEAVGGDGDGKQQSEDRQRRRQQHQRRYHRHDDDKEYGHNRERHRHRHERHGEDTRRDRGRDRERHHHRSDHTERREDEDTRRHDKHRERRRSNKGTLLSYDSP